MTRVRGNRLVLGLVWALACFCAAWAAMRTLGLERGFPLTAVVSWTPFMIPLALATCLGAGLMRRWGALALAGVASILLLVAVAPRAIGGGHEPAGADGPELRVLSTNLKLGRADAASVIDLVREEEVDVLCVQELTVPMLTRLADAGLTDLLTHDVAAPQDSSHGSAIFSRYPLRPAGSVEPDGYPFVMPRAAVKVPGAPPVDAVSVHPVPPTGSEAVGDWQAGLEALPEAAAAGPLTLLIGDFNATLDHREFREVLDRGYVDAGDATGKGLTATWPERLVRPGVAIDHVLADERVAITDYAVHELPGSDHRAVSAALRLPSDDGRPE